MFDNDDAQPSKSQLFRRKILQRAIREQNSHKAGEMIYTVFDREEFPWYLPDERDQYVAISLRTVQQEALPWAEVEPAPVASLDVAFDAGHQRAFRGLSIRQAQGIAAFSKEHYGTEVRHYVTVCGHGLTAAPAVAAALCRFFHGEDQRWFDRYSIDRSIYELVLDAMGHQGERAPLSIKHNRSAGNEEPRA